MSQDTRIQSKIETAREQVGGDTPESIIEAIASQLGLIEESRTRINEEGIVVRDMKGSVIPHPAIKIEGDAIKLMDSMLSKYKWK